MQLKKQEWENMLRPRIDLILGLMWWVTNIEANRLYGNKNLVVQQQNSAKERLNGLNTWLQSKKERLRRLEHFLNP